jgi:hypothetical protein
MRIPKRTVLTAAAVLAASCLAGPAEAAGATPGTPAVPSTPGTPAGPAGTPVPDTIAASLAQQDCIAGGTTPADATLAAQLSPRMNGVRLQSLNAGEASCARAITLTIRARGLPERAAVIAVTTAIAESTLHDYTQADDYDSLGLFQQRPSQGWGSPAQVEDPVYSTDKFIDTMRADFPNNGWMSGDIGSICQRVQGSAYPSAYDPEAPDAQMIVDALWTTPHLYALSPSGAGVWQYSGNGQGWQQLGGPAGVIYAGGSSLYATDPNTGNIYRYNGTPGSWSQIGGPGYTFALAGDTLYGLAPDRSMVMQFTGSGWIQVGGPAGQVYAGGAGLFATDPNTGDIYRYSGAPMSWGRIGGPGGVIAVAGNTLYATSPNRDRVMQWTGSGANWTQIGGPAANLYGTNMGLFAIDPNNGNINRFTGSGWINVGGPGYQFAATDHALYGLSPDQDKAMQWSGSGTGWFQIGGPADAIVAGR